MLGCRNIIVDVTITRGATSKWKVDGVCEGNRREEEEGECKLVEGEHGEGGSHQGE
jgi:hypothetical protein